MLVAKLNLYGAIANGGSIKLMEDITVSSQHVYSYKETVFDLNGHTITFDKRTLIINSTFTITDTTTEKNGTITNTAASTGNLLQLGGTSNVGNLTIESRKYHNDRW